MGTMGCRAAVLRRAGPGHRGVRLRRDTVGRNDNHDDAHGRARIHQPLAALPSVDPYAGMPLIDHTTWTEGVDGARLLVYPTEAGRREAFPDTEERAWQEVLTHSPDADTAGMRDQFVCHWVWARMVQPNKESWNLEPWRPAVGYQATVQASCNPGGPER